MITITITECRTDGRTWSSTHRTADRDVAVERAIVKHFGANHSLYLDRGLTLYPDDTRYGQIGHPIGNRTASMDTGRVRIDIEAA
ncbi:hypothetical protein [Chromobacterium phragmitis]|uniref:hypothetical protein n=1 Tax=Chromobacterium phragmitis TaxID=2202141 RepID=UPI003877D4B2